MDEEYRVPDPAEVKQAARVLSSKLGSYEHALAQRGKYGSSPGAAEWERKTSSELRSQWETLKAAMAQLGFD